jgi:ABC-type polysaccharide/polyol phosphate export permease
MLMEKAREKFAVSFQLSTILAIQDLKQAYRRSALGPFWITASMAVQITAMGLVFSMVFKIPLHEYLPFLATSIILFGLISTTVNESCMTFIASEPIIKQLKLPFFVYAIRVLLRNLLNFAHNLVIIPLVFLIFGQPFSLNSLLFIPGLLLFVLNGLWMALLLGMVSARFRDLPQMVASAMTIVYFVTPVMWQPTLIPGGTAHLLLGLNPFYHLLQVMRLPLLGGQPTLENWLLTIGLAAAGWALATTLLRRFGRQIAFWV